MQDIIGSLFSNYDGTDDQPKEVVFKSESKTKDRKGTVRVNEMFSGMFRRFNLEQILNL